MTSKLFILKRKVCMNRAHGIPSTPVLITLFVAVVLVWFGASGGPEVFLSPVFLAGLGPAFLSLMAIPAGVEFVGDDRVRPYATEFSLGVVFTGVLVILSAVVTWLVWWAIRRR
jgi:hypothetical protein